jgi:hypothetical protein
MASTKIARLAGAYTTTAGIEEDNTSDAQALREIGDLLATGTNVEACWPQVATRVAALCNAQWCAITAPGAGAAAALPPGADDATQATMDAPILLDAKLAATIRISGPRHKPRFGKAEREHLGRVVLVIEKSLQVIQLKQMLNARFAQLALVQNTDKAIGDVLLNTAQCPADMVKIIAKSFYREMTKAGFGSREIINTASEIIALLSKSLQKHSRRINNSRTPADAA